MRRILIVFSALAALLMLAPVAQAAGETVLIDTSGQGHFQPCGGCWVADTNRGKQVLVQTAYGVKICPKNRCMVIYPERRRSSYSNRGYYDSYGAYVAPMRNAYGTGSNIDTLMSEDSSTGDQVGAALELMGMFFNR